MASPSPSTSTIPPPVNKHALTPLERQRAQLGRLLKDPTKPVNIPAPPKEKTIRPPREMMKNVQGSSAGAGSGEFHVYKANRRREYERLKLMEETAKKETETQEFEKKRKDREEQAEAKTSKNRAKRMKKKERAQTKGKGGESSEIPPDHPASMGPGGADGSAPIKKRRLVNGSELVFRVPGEESDEEERDTGDVIEKDEPQVNDTAPQEALASVVPPKLTIYDSDN